MMKWHVRKVIETYPVLSSGIRSHISASTCKPDLILHATWQYQIAQNFKFLFRALGEARCISWRDDTR